MTIQRANILGVGVSAVNMHLALRTIDEWIAERRSHYVCITGVHGVMESQRDETIRRIHNAAGMVTPDGMPLVWLNHFQGFHHVERVYGPDLMLALCEHSVAHEYRHFLYGATDEVLERLSANLRRKVPGLQIVGTYAPPFRPLTPAEDETIVEMINDCHADIIWVGLSTPKQERWMAAHHGRLQTSVQIGVGAAFDFHAGLKPQAPYWMQRNGLEWLFRLATEPKRLWRRYLINNPRFVGLIIIQMLKLKHYPLNQVDQSAR